MRRCIESASKITAVTIQNKRPSRWSNGGGSEIGIREALNVILPLFGPREEGYMSSLSDETGNRGTLCFKFGHFKNPRQQKNS